MVEPVEQEAFYKPQRRDHTGESIKQEGKVAREEVKKVKLVMSGVSKRLKSQSGSKKVQDLKTYSIIWEIKFVHIILQFFAML